jgi:HK97 family phage portal protein
MAMFERLKSFLSQSADISLARLGFGDVNHGYEWTRQSALFNYERSLYANKAIDVRAKKISQIDFVVRDQKGDEVENEWSELLHKPNTYQTGDQLIFLAQKYYDIVGAAYILKVKADVPFPDEQALPDELHLLRSDQVEVLHNAAQTEILGFRYTRDGKQYDYSPEEVIYHYRPDPRNPLLGESLLSSCLRSIETETQISDYHNRLIRNGGKTGMIINFKDGQKQEVLDEMTDKFNKKYAGSENAGKPFLLSGNVDVHTQGMTPKEMDFIETKTQVLNDILIATGVPKPLLGIGSGETYANADAEIATFLRDKIKPELENWTNTLNWRLLPDQFELTFEDPTPEDRDQKRKDIELVDRMNVLTTNQKLQVANQLLGTDFEDVPNGDTILVPFSLTPMGTERPVREVQPVVEEPEEKSVKTFHHPLRDKAVRQMYGKQVDARARQNDEIMIRHVRDFFLAQEERIMQKLGRKRKVHKDLLGDIFDTRLEVSLAQSALVPILRDMFIASGQATADTFGSSFTADSSVEQSIRDRAEMFTNSIINTTSDQLALRISQNVDAGGTRQDLVASIRELYDSISQGRAEVIARTEVHTAMQNGNLEAYRQAGMSKIWVHVGDIATNPNAREVHAMMDGEERGVDELFSDGSLFPDAPNCRCTI